MINRPMKGNILMLFYSDRTGGGAENYLEMLAQAFAEEGYIIYMFFFVGKTTDRYTNNNNYKLYAPKAKRERFGLPFTLFHLVKTRKIVFDYAFTSFVFHSFIVGVLRKVGILKIKYFIARESTSIFKRFHGMKLFMFKIYYRFGYSAIDLLICQTKYMRNQLLTNMPCLKNKINNIEVMPNPFDMCDMLMKSNETTETHINQPYIISAGRFIDEKGFDILIKAFVKLKKDYKGLILVIFGRGKLIYFLTQLIKDLQLEKDVVLYGSEDDFYTGNLYPYFKNATMCVVSSRIEGFPNVLLQMMSQNEKVVSTLCAGYIDKIQGLFTCRTEDENDLFEAMRKCLNTDTSINRQLFDNELRNRSVDKFIDKINFYLNEGTDLFS
jgi:glycosyltransferase involved in cell wall biosynthesis